MTEDVLERIRKLQRLTKSSNEHEAALAAAKMQELLFKHNLSAEALTDPSEYVKENQKVGGRVWAQRLLSTLAHLNFCQPLAGSGYYVLIGKRENVAMVRELFRYLAVEVERLSKSAYAEYKATAFWPEPGKTWNAGFRNGCVSTIANRLREQRERNVAQISTTISKSTHETGTEIIRRLDLELQKAVSTFYPKLGRGAATQIRGSSKAYRAGQAAGHRVSLAPTKGNLH